MYLSDKEYEKILVKIKDAVNKDGFTPYCRDSDQIGNKYNKTNCGFCNDNFTDPETALFPDKFPVRKEMKYRKKHHICPFDTRQFGLTIKQPSCYTGCFYHCYLFNGGRDVELIRLMAEATLINFTIKKKLRKEGISCEST